MSSLFSEPTVPRPASWIATFALAWLGVWMAQLTPIQLLLPAQIDAELHPENWVESVVAFGVVSGIAGFFSLLAYPLTGALSDRTTSRFGRRRPWIVAGALVFAASLVALGLAKDVVSIGSAWTLASIGFCITSAALTATISDQVPTFQRGFVSGWISAPQAVGTILGLVLVTELFPSRLGGYAVIALLLLLSVAPFVLSIREERLDPVARPPLGIRDVLASLWLDPRAHPDFAWTLASRVLVNFGNAFGTTLLLFFLMFGLERGKQAESDLITLTLVYMFFVVSASLGLGKVSDRLGRRKPFVFLAAGFQGVAALLLAFVPRLDVAFVAAGILGLGFGCFLSVDQALATEVLPDPASRGKDLGIMNVATAVPQAVAPLLGAGIVVAWGFPGLFFLAASASIVGGLFVLPIRSVR